MKNYTNIMILNGLHTFKHPRITAAALLTHTYYMNRQSSSQFEKNNNWCEISAQRNGS